MRALAKEVSALEWCKKQSYVSKKGALEGNHYGAALSSVFQPIYSLAHRRPIGFEGLVRARKENGEPLSPIDLFRYLPEQHCIPLDRLTRYLHVQNFIQQATEEFWLFLNIHPAILLHGKNHGRFFGDLLSESGIAPNNVVVEILEDSIEDKGMLTETIQYYRDLGCLIAIDDFGTGNSNFDRVWKISPDIVKLDKSVVHDLSTNKVARRMLPNLVSLIHECGSLVLLEGVEQEEQALLAVDAGVDFVQGYYFAKPAAELRIDATSGALGEGGMNLSSLCSAYHNLVSQRDKSAKEKLKVYIDMFKTITDGVTAGLPIDELIPDLLSLSGIERCYLLNSRGNQVGLNFLPEEHERLFPQRFAMLEDTRNVSWFRRPYFRKAMNNPGEIQISRPYLSMTAGMLCITLSVMVKAPDGEKLVFCCDIDWSDN